MKITVSEMTMGKSVLISSQGVDGENAVHYTGRESRRTTCCGTGTHGRNGRDGESGTHGKDITLNIGKLKFVSFAIDTSGGKGGNGGNAKGGGKGSNGACQAQNGGAGGNGGRGGNGGNGGNSGNALVTFNEFTILPDANRALVANPYSWKAEGGIGGRPGRRGTYGGGGNGASCNCVGSICGHTVSGGNRGNRGAHGKTGNYGLTLDPNSIAWFRYH